MSWVVWALLSAVFAAATALLAKVGVAGIDSNLATAIRTTVIVVFTWAIALSLENTSRDRADRSAKLDISGALRNVHRTLVAVLLSGTATGTGVECRSGR